MTFGYSPDKILYSHVDLGADLDSRVAIVSPLAAAGAAARLLLGSLLVAWAASRCLLLLAPSAARVPGCGVRERAGLRHRLRLQAHLRSEQPRQLFLFSRPTHRASPAPPLPQVGPNGAGKSTLLKLMTGQASKRYGGIQTGRCCISAPPHPCAPPPRAAPNLHAAARRSAAPAAALTPSPPRLPSLPPSLPSVVAPRSWSRWMAW